MSTSTPSSRMLRRPTKKVTLNIKIDDEDLVRGKYRRVILASSTTKTTTKTKRAYRKRKSAFWTGGGRRRGRPRKSGVVVVSNEEEEGLGEWDDEVEVKQQQERQLGLEDFCLLSPCSFPMLLSREAEGDTQAKQAVEVPDRTRKRCACCGVEAPSDLDFKAESGIVQTIEGRSTDDTKFTQNANDRPISAVNSTSTKPSLPWNCLNLHPVRHVNPETNSIADLVITRSGPLPHTVGFWYDMTIAEQAKASDNIDFKMMCLNLMRWREWNDMSTLHAWSTAQATLASSDSSMYVGRCGAWWDDIVQDAVAMGKAWRKGRRRREVQMRKAGGWAVWEERTRRNSRDRFEEDHVGAWVLRGKGDDGEIVKVLKLGYRRRRRVNASTGPEGEIVREPKSASVRDIGNAVRPLPRTGRLNESALVDNSEAGGNDVTTGVDESNVDGSDRKDLGQ